MNLRLNIGFAHQKSHGVSTDSLALINQLPMNPWRTVYLPAGYMRSPYLHQQISVSLCS
jgi:hypothetical protein